MDIPRGVATRRDVSTGENIPSLIALNSRGSFRDAESLLDQCMSFVSPAEASAKEGRGIIRAEDIKQLLGIVEVSQIAQLVDFLVAKNTKEAVDFINLLCDSGVDLQELAKTLVFYLRQALLLKIDPAFLNLQNSGLSAQELEKIKSQTANLAQKDLQTMLELFIDAENKIKYSEIMQLPLELAIIDITQK